MGNSKKYSLTGLRSPQQKPIFSIKLFLNHRKIVSPIKQPIDYGEMLPDEIWLRIFEFVATFKNEGEPDLRALANLSGASRRFSDLASEVSLQYAGGISTFPLFDKTLERRRDIVKAFNAFDKAINPQLPENTLCLRIQNAREEMKNLLTEPKEPWAASCMAYLYLSQLIEKIFPWIRDKVDNCGVFESDRKGLDYLYKAMKYMMGEGASLQGVLGDKVRRQFAQSLELFLEVLPNILQDIETRIINFAEDPMTDPNNKANPPLSYYARVLYTAVITCIPNWATTRLETPNVLQFLRENPAVGPLEDPTNKDDCITYFCDLHLRRLGGIDEGIRAMSPKTANYLNKLRRPLLKTLRNYQEQYKKILATLAWAEQAAKLYLSDLPPNSNVSHAKAAEQIILKI